MVSRSGERYPIVSILGSGTYGSVYQSSPGRVIKIISNVTPAQFRAEVDIQKAIHSKEPSVCPEVYAYGKVGTKFVVVMEQFEGTVETLLKTTKRDDLFLEWLDQTARIMQKLEPYQFNHRDLKPDNMMYRKQGEQYKFVLIDFGFACATIDGKKYSGGSTYLFPPAKAKCFLRSRDIAQMLYASLKFYMRGMSADIIQFVKLLLTFDIKGKRCEMFNGCPPHKIDKWLDTYRFLNDEAIENPSTTPEGLLHAIDVYRRGGIRACKPGFVEHPVAEVCVADPGVRLPKQEEPKSPAAHVLDPAPGKECPPGKILNPATKRCVKEDGAIGRKLRATVKKAKTKTPVRKTSKKPCPPGKILNPATKRCVKEDGAIGRKLK